MSRIAIDPTDLEAFLKVAELGSFSRAGASLGMSQPAVTARIGRLETRLGQALLQRTTRRVQLTDAGEHFRLRAAVIVQQLQGLHDDFTQAPHERQQGVTLGAHASISNFLMPELVVGYAQTNPRTRITLRDGSGPFLIQELIDERIELALFGGLDDHPPELEFSTLYVEECVLVAKRSHPLVQGPEVELADVVNYPFMALSQKVSMWKTLLEEAGRRNLPLAPAFEAESLLTLVGLAEAGMGSTLVPLSVSRKLDGRIYGFSRIRGLVLTRTVNIAKLRHRVLSPAAHAFGEFLRARLKQQGLDQP